MEENQDAVVLKSSLLKQDQSGCELEVGWKLHRLSPMFDRRVDCRAFGSPNLTKSRCRAPSFFPKLLIGLEFNVVVYLCDSSAVL